MESDDNSWYAIRVTYSRELKLKQFLDERSIKCFLPMCYEVNAKSGKKTQNLIPVIHNLIFIYSNRKLLDQIKPIAEHFAGMRYMIDTSSKAPIIVPDAQMQNFITVAGTLNDDIKYLSAHEMGLLKGDKVRVTGGAFAGVEGIFVKLNGTRARRVLIEVSGITAVATTSISPSLIEKI